MRKFVEIRLEFKKDDFFFFAIVQVLTQLTSKAMPFRIKEYTHINDILAILNAYYY